MTDCLAAAAFVLAAIALAVRAARMLLAGTDAKLGPAVMRNERNRATTSHPRIAGDPRKWQ